MRFSRAVGLAILAFLAYLAITFFIPEGRPKVVLTDIIYPLIDLAAAAGLWLAARQSFPHSRRLGMAWSIMAAGQLAMTIGDVLWSILEAGLNLQPFPSIADGAYVLFYPLFLIGIFLLPVRKQTRLNWLETLLDVSLMVLAFVLVMWNYAGAPLILLDRQSEPLVQVLTVFYPLGSLALLWALLELIFRQSFSRKYGPLLLLAAGMVLMLLADGFFSYQSLIEAYESGNWVDLAYVSSFLLTGLAGYLQAQNAQAATRPAEILPNEAGADSKVIDWLAFFPDIWIVLAFLLSVFNTQHTLPTGNATFITLIGVMIILVLIRHLISHLEVSQLNRQLNRTLQHVRGQAETLESTNQLLEAIIKYSPLPITVLDEKRKIKLWSPAAERLFGWSEAEILGKDLPFVPEGKRAEVNHELDEEFHGVARKDLEIQKVTKDGSPIDINLSTAPLYNSQGQINGSMAILADITARKKDERELLERERQFDQLIRQMPYPVAIATPDGKLLSVNQALRDLLQVDAFQIFIENFNISGNPEDIPQGIGQAIQQAMQGIVSTVPDVQVNHNGELIAANQAEDPSPTFMDLTIFPVFGDRGEIWRIAAIMKDYSERKKAERLLKQRLDELEILHSVAQAGTEATSLSELFEKVSRVIANELDPDNFGIALIRDGNELLSFDASTHTRSGQPVPVVPLNHGISGAVARSGLPRRSGDVHSDPDYIEVEPAVQSELCVPIMNRDRILGVINIEDAQPDAYDETDERLMMALAGELGTAIEKVRFLEAAQARRRELEILGHISTALRDEQSARAMFPLVLDRLAEVLDTHGAAIATIDFLRGTAMIELGNGEWARLSGVHMSIHSGLCKLVISEYRTYVTGQSADDAGLRQSSPFNGLDQLACAPLIADDQVIGLLTIGRGTPFSAADIRLLEAIADMFAGSLHRATLHEATEDHLRRLTTLQVIDKAILATVDLRMMLSFLLEQITTHLEIDAADVLIYHPVTQTLESAANQGLVSPVFRNASFRLGDDSIPGRAALEQKMILISDLGQIEDSLTTRLRKSGENFTGYVALPLVSKGEIKGVLQVFKRTRLDPRPAWVEFLHSLADLAIIAIDNAQMYDQQQKANLRLSLAYDETIEGWSRALDYRDRKAEGHSQRVTDLALVLCKKMGIPDEELPNIRRGTQLHDIGKMALPDSILLKPGPLSDDEWTIMRQHPRFAYELLAPIEYLRKSLDIPYCHHENWDGSGYPRGLKGEAIPLPVRIFSVVNVWDSLCHDRPFRLAWPADKALAYIQQQAGKLFDPEVVQVFLSTIHQGEK